MGKKNYRLLKTKTNTRYEKRFLCFFFRLSILMAFYPSTCLYAAGTTSATFLKLGVGARPVGMGSAFAGVADDVGSVVWNPAGLANVDAKEFSFMHLEHFQGVRYDSLCYAHPRGKTVVAFGFGYLYTDDITRTFIDDDTYAGFRAQGDYRLEDRTFFVAAARQISDDKAVGALVRWLSERIEDNEASGLAADVGYLHLVTDRLAFGLSVQNIGGTIRFIAADEMLPLTFRAGFGYDVVAGKLKLALDFVKPVDYQLSVNLGAEYRAFDALAVRGGWSFKDLFDDDRLDGTSGAALGMGLSFYNYSLDYAFAPYGELGYSHRISLGGKF